MPFQPFIDRASTVALGVQLKGQVEYAIACGELTPGDRLPTVRQLARRLGVSPVTISQVYQELQKNGLLVARPGRGTFVTDAIGIAVGDERGRHLEALMDRVTLEGHRLGLDHPTLERRFADHLEQVRSAVHAVTILLVGLFEGATKGYAEALQAEVSGLAQVRATTFDDLPADARPVATQADLFVTLPYRVSTLRERLGADAPISYLRFLPSHHTRVSLAGIDPRDTVLGVARLPGFLPALEAGIARYAPHVVDIAYCLATDPHLPNMLTKANVVVYASGAEIVRAHLGGHERVFEFRHAPDPAFVERHLLPLIHALKAGRPLPSVPLPPAEADRASLVEPGKEA